MRRRTVTETDTDDHIAVAGTTIPSAPSIECPDTPRAPNAPRAPPATGTRSAAVPTSPERATLAARGLAHGRRLPGRLRHVPLSRKKPGPPMRTKAGSSARRTPLRHWPRPTECGDRVGPRSRIAACRQADYSHLPAPTIVKPPEPSGNFKDFVRTETNFLVYKYPPRRSLAPSGTHHSHAMTPPRVLGTLSPMRALSESVPLDAALSPDRTRNGFPQTPIRSAHHTPPAVCRNARSVR